MCCKCTPSFSAVYLMCCKCTPSFSDVYFDVVQVHPFFQWSMCCICTTFVNDVYLMQVYPIFQAYWEPVQKRAQMQLVREHFARVISARWATVDWSLHKEWNWCAQANLHFTKKKREREREQVGNEESNTVPKSTQALKKPPPHLSVRMCWCAARKHCFWTGVFCLTCCKCLFGVVVFFGECVLLCCKCVLSLNRQLV